MRNSGGLGHPIVRDVANCDLEPELPRDNVEDGGVLQDSAQDHDAEWPQSEKDDVCTRVMTITHDLHLT